MEKGARLREVAEPLGDKFADATKIPRASRKYANQLTFYQQLPGGLEDLLVGKRGP